MSKRLTASTKVFILFLILVLRLDIDLGAQTNPVLASSNETDTTFANQNYVKAENFTQNAQYDSARGYYQKAAVLYEKAEKASHDTTLWARQLNCQNKVGGSYLKKAAFGDALKVFEKTLELGLRKIGATHPEVAQSYNGIGLVFYNQSDYNKALEYYQKSLAIRMKVFGENHALVGRNYNNIGIAYARMGDNDHAFEYFKKSLSIKRAVFGKNHIEVATAYNNNGLMARRMGEYDDALEYFQKSFEIRKGAYGKNHPDVASSSNNIGLVYEDKGDYDRALEYHKKAAAIFLSTLKGNHPRLANSYINIGNILRKLGDYDKALEYYRRSLQIRIAAYKKNHPAIAGSYNNIGLVFNDKRDYAKALEYYQKAASIFRASLGEKHLRLANTYNNIGIAYSKKGEDDKALEYAKKALAIRVPALGTNHPRVAGSYNNMGLAYIGQGDYEHGFEYLHKALTIKMGNFGKKHPAVAATLISIADAYFKKEAFNQALSYCQKAIISLAADFADSNIYRNPLLRAISSETDMVKVLSLKAAAFERLDPLGASAQNKNLRMSLLTYQRATELIDKMRVSYKAQGSKLFLGEETSQIYNNSIKIALKHYELTNDVQYKKQAFEFSEKSKAAVLYQTLSESNARSYAGIPDTLLEKERKLRIDLAYYGTHIQKGGQTKDLEKHYFELTRQYDELIAKFEVSYPKYYNMKYNAKVSSAVDLQEALADSEAILEYSIGDSTLTIFVITKHKFDIDSTPIDASFQESIHQFRRAIKKLDKREFLKKSAALYTKLIQPVEGFISSKKKLIIIPDETLYYIPFEALIAESPPEHANFSRLRYLIRNHEISYHYSASLFLQHSLAGATYAPDIRQERFIGFAPVFSDIAKNGRIVSVRGTALDSSFTSKSFRSITIDGERLSELKFTESEVDSIIHLFENQKGHSVGYFHQDASEENFKTRIHQYKFVHVATHGMLNEMQPRLSAIIFSQPEDSDHTEDGVLYANEIYNLKLSADLVTLSSCESGIGKLVKGEGLMALTRGFFYAGVPNIVVSLWKVSDDNTRKLMVEFYRHVSKGEGYSSSLRAAKLALLENIETAFPDAWSAFVHIGR